MAQQHSKITSTQRMTVRMVLATGATIAALIGAQNLALTGRSSSAAANNNTANTSTSDQNYSFFGGDDESSAFQQTQSFSSSQFGSQIQAAPDQPNPFSQASR